MNALRFLPLLFLFISVVPVRAQEASNFWQLGIGYNFVDDSGPGLDDYFNFKEIWHAVPYPSRLTVGYYMTNGFGVEAIGSYNEYDAGKIVDGMILPEDQTYVALDGKISYDLNKLIGQTGWFDPYVMTGAGYTWIGAADRATFNAGGGFNTWFTETVGLNVNAMGKWGLFTDRGTNHMQYSVGLIFKLGRKDQLVLEEPEEVVNTAVTEEEVSGDEDKEVVITPIPVTKPTKTEAELRAERMLRELNDLPVVYFAFDSSYLTKEDKEKVDLLVSFMKAYPEIRIEVQAHADARGPDHYNTWLSERRAKRIVDYAIAQGMNPDRMSGKGFGENKILNRCTNGVSCSEEEHRENRRTTYILSGDVKD